MKASADMQGSVKCSLVIGFGFSDQAEKVHRAVELDNDGYLDSRVSGCDILAEISADSLRSLLHTLDDFLSCVSVAERIVSRDG